MSRLLRSPRLGGRAWGALVLAALVLAVPAAAAPAPAPPARGQDPVVPLAGARAEIRFPAPVRHAIIRQGPAGAQMLVAPGDLVFHPQDPTRALTIERVEAGAVLSREGPSGRRQVLHPGQPLPGFPGWLLTGTVLLDQVHYRYRVVDRLTHPDPVLLALEGTRAILEVETLSPPGSVAGAPSQGGALPSPQPSQPARATLDGDLLEKVRVQEVRPGLYDVPAADVQAVMDNAGRVLTDLWPTVQPSLSLQTGLEYRLTSAAGDGVLSRQGFTVTAPKLAERAGIQVGDTILSVNGRPVDGFASLYAIFRAVRQDPALRTVQVELDRGGARLTKTYRVR